MHVDLIPLECCHEAFCQSIRFGDSCKSQALHQSQQFCEGERFPIGVCAAVAFQSLDRSGRHFGADSVFLRDNHQSAGRFTSNSFILGFPSNHFPTPVVDHKGDTNHAPISTRNSKPVRRSKRVRVQRHHFPFVRPYMTFAGVSRQLHPVLRHDPVDVRVVQQRQDLSRPLRADDGCNTAVTKGRALIDGYPNGREHLKVVGLGIASKPHWHCFSHSPRQLRTGYAQPSGNGFESVLSSGGERSREISFFWCASLTAPRRISFSVFFLSRTRTSSQMRFFNSLTSAATAASPPAWIVCLPSSVIRLLQLKCSRGELPYLRPTYETVMPGRVNSWNAHLSPDRQYLHRFCTSVTTETGSISNLRPSHMPSRMARRYENALCPIEMRAVPI